METVAAKPTEKQKRKNDERTVRIEKAGIGRAVAPERLPGRDGRRRQEKRFHEIARDGRAEGPAVVVGGRQGGGEVRGDREGKARGREEEEQSVEIDAIGRGPGELEPVDCVDQADGADVEKLADVGRTRPGRFHKGMAQGDGLSGKNSARQESKPIGIIGGNGWVGRERQKGLRKERRR